MSNELNVFVVAAGYGKRLRPVTEQIPKPLLPVLGKPLLSSVLERVAALPVNHIGINLHHKAEAIAAWIEGTAFREEVKLFNETDLLGTGGALKNASGMLAAGTFLVHNSDIVTDLDLVALLSAHRTSGNIATLAVHDCPQFNTVSVRGDGVLIGVGDGVADSGGSRSVAFTGVAVYEPALLSYLPEGVSSVVDAWLAALADGHAVGTTDVTGCHWRDLGTPSSYASAVIEMLRIEGEWVHFTEDVHEADVELDGYVIVEDGVGLGKGARLRNCILLPGTALDDHDHCENCIVGPGYRISLSEPDMLGLPLVDHGLQIGVGGSERQYFRVWQEDSSIVRMVCTPDEPDYDRHMAYSQFFSQHGVPIPNLLSVDRDAKQAEFEDLGDLSLYSWLKFPRSEAEVEHIYRRILDILVLLHTQVTDCIEECALLKSRIFDFDYFRWETAYFQERFVEGACGVTLEPGELLDAECDAMAHRADNLEKCVIHRDYQSQNVMITRGEPRIIDYQGARMAPPAYDVASILWDPYYRLDDTMRARLVMYYEESVGERAGETFREGLLLCRLQRHMQALGAYGFLSTIKGKPHFSKFIPEGMRLLEADLAECPGEYPAIEAAVRACHEHIHRAGSS